MNKHVLAVVDLGLTFACLYALRPAVVHISVAGTTTILVPRASRSATTDSPGLLERATVRTYNDCCYDVWHAG